VAVVVRFVGDERVVLPKGYAILAPISGQSPARELFSGIPFALAIMQECSGRKSAAKTFEEIAGEDALPLRQSRKVPFGTVGVVDGNEGWLSAHGEADVALVEVGIDGAAEAVDLDPLFFGVRPGDARRFLDARDLHFVMHL